MFKFSIYCWFVFGLLILELFNPIKILASQDTCTKEYPVAVWHNFGGTADYATKIRDDAGANILMGRYGSLSSTLEALNAAKAARVKVILNMTGFVGGGDFASSVNMQDQLRTWLNGIKNNEGLYGYMYFDEPEINVPMDGVVRKNFKPIIDFIRQIDSAHPTMVHMVNTGDDRALLYTNYADMTGLVWFPYWNPNDSTVKKQDGSPAYMRNLGELRNLLQLLMNRVADVPNQMSRPKNLYRIIQGMGMWNCGLLSGTVNCNRDNIYWPSEDQLMEQINITREYSDNFGLMWWYFYEWPGTGEITANLGEVPMIRNPEFMSRVKNVSLHLQEMYKSGELKTDYPVTFGCDSYNADLNKDGKVDLNDFLFWKQGYISGTSNLSKFLDWKGSYDI